MTRTLLFLSLALSSSCAAQFEVASVKPSDPSRQSSSTGMASGKGRITANELTLKRYIMGAYGVGQKQIIGGPDWLDTDRFDITARAEQAVNDDELLMKMLQGLLAERFKLVVRRETRLTQAYVLTVAKSGPKLEKSAGGEASTNSGRGRIEARNTTLEAFAQRLGRQLELPVVDKTGLDGMFNFKLEWQPDDTAAAAARPDSLPSIFPSIQQLGLRLAAQKIPVEMLVVEHAEKPSDN